MQRLQQILLVILGFAGCFAPSSVYAAEDLASVEIVDEIWGRTTQVPSSDLSGHLFPGDKVSILVWDGTTTEAIVNAVETAASGDAAETRRQVLVVRVTDGNREWRVTPAEIAQITIHEAGLASGRDDFAENSEGRDRPGSNACADFATGTTKADTSWGSAWGLQPGFLSTLSTSFGSTTTTFCLPTVTTEKARAGDDTAFYRLQQRRLVATHQDRLAIDFANGGGEYASSLAWLQGCPADSHARYASLVRRNFARVFALTEDGPEQLLTRLETQLLQDPELTTECTRVS